MHPAFSVILFTTTSGAGYGLLIWLCLGYLGLVPTAPLVLPVGVVITLLLITTGLLSSTFHLGRPERAWRAFSQWRSSWLSREGVMALVTYVPAAVLALNWLFGLFGDAAPVAAWLAIVFCLVTVFTTAMIYASLKTVMAWHTPWTPLAYLVLALMTGALIFSTLNTWLGQPSANMTELTIGCLLSGWLVKVLYWRAVKSAVSATTIQSATGLTQRGQIQQLQAPHSHDNYLLKEMGFKIARKHATRLRRLAIVMGLVLPVLILLGSLFTSLWLARVATLLACLLVLLGVFVERWLFFAEAKHTMALYYGQ